MCIANLLAFSYVAPFPIPFSTYAHIPLFFVCVGVRVYVDTHLQQDAQLS